MRVIVYGKLNSSSFSKISSLIDFIRMKSKQQIRFHPGTSLNPSDFSCSLKKLMN